MDFISKFLSFFAGVVDTADKHSIAIISSKFLKIRNDPNGILRGPGDTDLWKNPKSKISCQTPKRETLVSQNKKNALNILIIISM